VRCQRIASKSAGLRFPPFPSALFSLLMFLLMSSASVFAAPADQALRHPQKGSERAVTTSPQSPDLRSRLTTLESAKQSGDPTLIANASRSVLAIALREMAAMNLAQNLVPAAIDNLKRSLDFENSPATRLDLAQAYLLNSRLDESLSTVTDCLVADPDNRKAWYVQGKVWMLKKRYDEAVHSFQRALDLQTDPSAWYLEGAALLLDNQNAAAKDAFDNISAKGISIQSFVADAKHAAGYAKQSALHPSAATNAAQDAFLSTVLRNARRLPSKLETPIPTAHQKSQIAHAEPDLRVQLASALNDLGTTEARQQNYELALAHFREAAGWKADLPGLMRNTGIAASRSGNYAETIRALRPVITENPGDTVARSLLGTALFATQSYADAVQVFAPLGDAGLQSQDLAYAWAASLVRTNKFPAAADMLKKLEQQQLTADTLVLVAQFWSQMGNYEHTIEVCHRAVELDPKAPRAHYLAGLAFLRLNRSADASPEFENELLIAPDNVDAEYHLAFSLLQQSQNDRAVELWKKVLISNPDHPEANYELGKELLIEGHATEALPYLQAAVRLKPEFEPAHYQLQSAYRAVGRKEDADREATVYRAMKAKSRNITLPPPRTLDATAPLSK
jgi:tetratricopeptide (TPR) repeat protein